MAQASFHCPRCNQMKLFTGETMNHTPHILASIFLCGLYLPVWIVLAITDKPAYHCSACGYTAAPKYLANPLLREQEARQAQYLAQARTDQARERAISGETSLWEQITEFPYLTHIGIGIFVVCLLASIAAVVSVMNNPVKATLPTPTATATPSPTATPQISPVNKKSKWR